MSLFMIRRNKYFKYFITLVLLQKSTWELTENHYLKVNEEKNDKVTQHIKEKLNSMVFQITVSNKNLFPKSHRV